MEAGELVNDSDFKVVEAMETYGGSFVQALAKCFRLADMQNFEKLKSVFSVYWGQYQDMAAKL